MSIKKDYKNICLELQKCKTYEPSAVYFESYVFAVYSRMPDVLVQVSNLYLQFVHQQVCMII